MSGSPDISASSVSTAGYEDGLGRRSVRFNREVGGMLECLHLRPPFVVFEPALRARAEALGRLEDERFALVREFERDATGLHVISDLVAGQRLIDVLETRSEEAAVSGIDAAFGFLLQAMPALAQLHVHSITHGAVAPGRIIITPNTQVVLLDNIYGTALERLHPTRQTLWSSFGVMAAAPVGGGVSLDRHADVGQVALCALLLALGRPLDHSASVASLVPLVREIAELAEIRAGSSFAEGVGRFFIDALPAVGKRRSLEADQATAAIRQLLTHISEDESLSALAELVSYRPVPARPRAASPVEAAQSRPPISIAVVAPPPVASAIPAPVAAIPIAEPTPQPIPEPAPVPTIQTPVVAPATSFTQYTPQAQTVESEQPAVEPLWTPPPSAVPVWTPPPPAVTVWTPPAVAAPVQPSVVMPARIAVQISPAPAQPPFVAVQPPRIPVGPPQLTPAVHVAPPAPPAVLKIRQEGPPGYAPIRVRDGVLAPEAESTARALSFLDRAAEQGGGFPWKIAAAAVLVLLVGGAAGRDYLLGGTAPEPAEKAAAPAPAPVVASTTTGGLIIDSQPPGAKVTLDGKEVGSTPLTLEAIKPGRHQVTVTSGSALVQRSIRIEAGKQATINVPVFSGWVAIFAPIRLEVSAGRRSLGSTEDGRILLPPGKHVLTLSSAEFGYTRNETVEITPGEERVLNLQPTGTVNLNASPWAEVWVDGKRAGETPLANLEVLLGTREFVFKHPQYGERKLTATITTTNSPLSVDFGRPPSRP
ncbi:MAG: PEGA domain-containing protein [Acidobacteriota bacterium]|nr:PEGA domain-containing protein [Acidobacteriota bacterium]